MTRLLPWLDVELMRQTAAARSYADIDGWFHRTDHELFTAILESQCDSTPGTLVELGCYLGKSAVVIGEYQRDDEEVVVVDLFGESPRGTSRQNRAESRNTYPRLTRKSFEDNYRSVLGRLPSIIEGPSSTIVDHVVPQSTRFLHVDASHLYPEVRVDVRNAKRLLRPDGVVVFDDFRSVHTPGVAAAVWEGVFTLGLVPVAVTHGKFYGSFGDPSKTRDVIEQRARHAGLAVDAQRIAGHPVLRVYRTDDGGWSKVAREVARQMRVQRWPGYRVMHRVLLR